MLAVGGVDLRTQRWSVRRTRLEQLAASWSAPLQVSPMTADVSEAREWLEILPEAMGVEGLVVKGAGLRYVGGRREWLKVKHRDTVEVIAGRYTATSELVMVGRTVVLTAAQPAELAAVLSPARRDHPWPDEISSQRRPGPDTPINPIG
ncbi:ATP-dependent DNA ligase [Kribbella sp. CWNU-51]